MFRCYAPDKRRDTGHRESFGRTRQAGVAGAGVERLEGRLLLSLVPAGESVGIATTGHTVFFPEIAMDADGDFVATWSDSPSAEEVGVVVRLLTSSASRAARSLS